MPPLNNFVVDEHLVVSRTSPNTVRSISTSSFERELNDEDPTWKFAFPPRRQQRSVSFNHHIQVEYLPNREDWSEDEMASRWNSADDYTNFQLDIFNTMYVLRNDPESIDDACHTSRGVECRDPIATRYRRQIRREAREVVFERQNIQRQMNDEPNGYNYLIASVYCHATQAAMRLALDFAAQDELDASKIRDEEHQLNNQEVDFFDHDWISTNASSRSENSSLSSIDCSSGDDDDDDEFGFCILGDKSGFDNSWLRGDV